MGILANMTPPEVNSILKDHQGYAKGCLVIFDRAATLLGLISEGRGKTVKRYPCIAWTDNFASKGVPQHFFVCLNDTDILDPLSGTQKKNPYHIVEYVNIYPKEDTLSAAEQAELAQLRNVKNELMAGKQYEFRIEGGTTVYQVYAIPSPGHFEFIGDKWENIQQIPVWTDSETAAIRLPNAVQAYLDTKVTLSQQQSVNDALRTSVQSMKDHPIEVEKIVTKEVIKEVPVEKIVTVEKIVDLNEKVASEAARVAMENVDLHRQLTNMTFGDIIIAFWNKIKNK
jgi:hypothetical protein